MKYKLDLEDDSSAFEGWAFVHIHTSLAGYALADMLNRLYDYQLTRLENLVVEGLEWPLYHHDDTVAHLKYFLLERPLQAEVWDAGDKLLAIAGDTAEQEADRICSDLTEPAHYDSADLLAQEHAALVDELLASFTVAGILDFGSTEGLSRKALRDRNMAEQYCNRLIESIEIRYLDLGSEDRRRAEEKLFSVDWK